MIPFRIPPKLVRGETISQFYYAGWFLWVVVGGAFSNLMKLLIMVAMVTCSMYP